LKKSTRYEFKRILGFMAGIVLFYAPFALFQKMFIFLFKISGRADIHWVCFRMGVQRLLSGEFLNIISTEVIIILLLLIIAFFAGPFFCGRLCLVGAIPEYLSRIVPKRLKLKWQKYLRPEPVKYGVLFGFIATSFFGLSVTCSYCNYALTERMILGIGKMDMGVLSSTNILLMIVWLLILGAFCQGGRGFCSYLCPVGSSQSLLHAIGNKTSIVSKIKFRDKNCVSCSLCEKVCPMGAIEISEKNQYIRYITALGVESAKIYVLLVRYHNSPNNAYENQKDKYQKFPFVFKISFEIF
jgi:polyferredoxin